MNSGPCYVKTIRLYILYIKYISQDLALDYLKGLICHETESTKIFVDVFIPVF